MPYTAVHHHSFLNCLLQLNQLEESHIFIDFQPTRSALLHPYYQLSALLDIYTIVYLNLSLKKKFEQVAP